MPGRSRKTKAAPTFDYTALGDAEKTAREAAGRISTRIEAEARAKEYWTRHGLDILIVRRAAKHGHFIAWVKHETPFTVRLAQMMSDAAAMLVEHLKSENFSHLPTLDKAVTYTLAAPSTPESVRAEYLPRLLAGEKGLRKLVNAALKTEAVEGASDQPKTVEPPPAPSKRVVALVDNLPDEDGRAVLALITEGETESLRRALEWRFLAPVVPHAHRIREHARAAIRDTPQLDLLMPDVPVLTEADETESDDTETSRLH